MIVGDLKPVKEIASSIAEFNKILILGCGGCVTVCLSGGDREANSLYRELSKKHNYEKKDPPSFKVETIQRQCEPDWLKSYLSIPDDIKAVLSLACGAGVQTMAAIFDPLPIIPALNTTFIGATAEQGVFNEMCRGCGDCMLAVTGGICPVARCSKSLFNGPCGGTNNGKCEIKGDIPCAWAEIFEKLKKQDKLHLMTEMKAPRDWRPAGGSGPRSLRKVFDEKGLAER